MGGEVEANALQNKSLHCKQSLPIIFNHLAKEKVNIPEDSIKRVVNLGIHGVKVYFSAWVFGLCGQVRKTDSIGHGQEFPGFLQGIMHLC